MRLGAGAVLFAADWKGGGERDDRFRLLFRIDLPMYLFENNARNAIMQNVM